MSHYFISDPNLPVSIREIRLSLFDREFRFITHNGLFSYEKIDEASLLLIKKMPPVSGAFLDLGCGYGVIGITLAKQNNIALTMSDVNREAVECAGKNAELNNVKAEVIHSNGFDSIHASFDHIALNPPIHAGKEIIFRMYRQAYAHLNPGGAFYIVIQKKHGAESSIKKIVEIYQNYIVIYKKKGYFILKAER